MTTSRIATALSLAGAAFILYIGISYLFTPDTIAPGFGLPAWPDGDAAAFMNLKGVRDTVFGILILVLLAAKQRYALGIATLVIALVPVGDMLTVLSWSGSSAAAFGIHGLTAALVFLTGAMLLREHQLSTKAAPQPIAVPA